MLEILACHGRQLGIGWVVGDDGIHDRCSCASRVAAAPFAELVTGKASTAQQHFTGTCQSLGKIGEKSAVVIAFTLLLVLAVRLDALCVGLVAVKYHHVGFGMVHPDNRVKSASAMLF